jgi:type IV secretion system protein VirB6
MLVFMSIVTKFVTGMEQSVLDSLLAQANSASSFITAGATPAINAAAIELAGIACCVIYTVGTVFFFETPRIVSGIVGGAASGGHGFLQSTGNAGMSRFFARRGSAAGGGGARAAGGSIRPGG